MKKPSGSSKVKYNNVSTTDQCENEILLNDFDNRHVKLNFDSIHEFHSIHTYTKTKDLYRVDAQSICAGECRFQLIFLSMLKIIRDLMLWPINFYLDTPRENLISLQSFVSKIGPKPNAKIP
jgi:hypothetical protein